MSAVMLRQVIVPSDAELRLRMGEMTSDEILAARLGVADGAKQVGELNIPAGRRVLLRLMNLPSTHRQAIRTYQAAFRLGHYLARH